MSSVIKDGIIVFLFFVLAIVQMSFLPYFGIAGQAVNPLFILFFIMIFFSKTGQIYEGIFITVLAGIMLDITSPYYFGVGIISLLGIYLFTTIMKTFLIENQNQFAILYFIPMFLISLAFYETIFYVVGNMGHIFLSINLGIFIGLACNLVISLIGFFIYKVFIYRQDRQLKLFD